MSEGGAGGRPSGPLSPFRYIPGLKRLALFAGIATAVAGPIYGTIKFVGLQPTAVHTLLWAASLWTIASLGSGILHLQLRLHRTRRETGGLEAQVKSLTAALGAQQEANHLTNHASISSITGEIHTILGFDYQYCTWLLDNIATASQKDIEHEFDKYLGLLLTHTAQLFHIYTRHPCAACLKVLRSTRDAEPWSERDWTPGGDKVAYVYTQGRDPMTRYQRSASDVHDGYEYTRNAIFRYLVEEEGLGGFYFENDLHNPKRPYYSDNPKWPNFYNATAVSLIDCPDPASGANMMGFLCIDNFGGRFDDAGTKYILRCVASILYYSMGLTFIAINEIQEPAS
jgi:hypothetical protein